MVGDLPQRRELVRRMRLAPALAQELIRLRSIDVEGISVRGEEGDGVGPVGPRPRLPIIAFDEAQRGRLHGPFLTLLAAASRPVRDQASCASSTGASAPCCAASHASMRAATGARELKPWLTIANVPSTCGPM